MHLSTISQWLSWIRSIHNEEIDLGLERVKEVGFRLNILNPDCLVITVAGTNGKGSTVAGLEAIYRSAGYHVGAFTSPMLIKPNEQVRIDGKEATDEEFCRAFEKVEKVRGTIPLTSFEFFTLAALLIFKSYSLSLLLLEVGLGGRLDAVNIIDATVAVVTSIGIDHVHWLGSTREAIAIEKAGIFREHRPAVCGDFNPPASLIECASQVGAPFFIQGKDFCYQENSAEWTWSSTFSGVSANENYHFQHLPLNRLATQNMSTVLMAVTLLQDKLPVSLEAIKDGLSHATLPARVQIIQGEPIEIYDVAHNPDAVAYLANRLRALPGTGKTWAVFSMLTDKDILTSIEKIRDEIQGWYVAPLSVTRAATSNVLLNVFQQANIVDVSFFSSIKEAYRTAKHHSSPNDRLLIFGSFHTVAEAMAEATFKPRAHISTL